MDQTTRTDITVNVEGFWMLQALLDIRHVAPELRCRPFVSTDSMDWLNEHPGMAVMREQGIVDGESVNEAIAARMRVLAAPDLEIVALLSRGKLLYGVKEQDEGGAEEPVGSRDIPDNEFRVLLARRGQRWVSAVRVGTRSPSTTSRSRTPPRSRPWSSMRWSRSTTPSRPRSTRSTCRSMFSLGHSSTQADVDALGAVIGEAVERARRAAR